MLMTAISSARLSICKPELARPLSLGEDKGGVTRSTFCSCWGLILACEFLDMKENVQELKTVQIFQRSEKGSKKEFSSSVVL